MPTLPLTQDAERPTSATSADQPQEGRPWIVSSEVRPLWFEYLWMVAGAHFRQQFVAAVHANSGEPAPTLRRKIGRETLIRNIHVKFPWNLEIGDRCWLGEGVWLHNQDKLTIGADSVISQQSFITTGSHDLDRDDGPRDAAGVDRSGCLGDIAMYCTCRVSRSVTTPS